MRHACKIVTVLVLAAFPLLGEKQHIRLAMLEGEMLQRYSAEIERRLNKNLATMLPQEYTGFRVFIIPNYEEFRISGDLNEYQFFKGSGLQYILLGGRNALIRSVYHGRHTYRSIIVVNPGSGIETLRDIPKRQYAFTSPYSASGYLYPKMYLADQGVFLEDRFAQKQSQRLSAEQILKWISDGTLDAGFVYEGVQDNPACRTYMDSVKVLEIIPWDIPNDPLWVATWFYRRYPVLSMAVAAEIMKYQNAKNDPFYSLTQADDNDYDSMRRMVQADMLRKMFPWLRYVKTEVMVFVLAHIVWIALAVTVVVLAVMMRIARRDIVRKYGKIVSKHDAAIRQLQELSAESKRAERNFLALSEERKRLERDFRSLEDKKNELQQRVNAYAQLQEEFEKTKAHVEDLEKKAASAQRGDVADTLLHAEKETHEMGRKIAEVEAMLTNANKEKEQLQNDIAKEKQRVAKLEIEIAKAKATLEKNRNVEKYLKNVDLRCLLKQFSLGDQAMKDISDIKDVGTKNHVMKKIIDFDRYYPEKTRLEKYNAGKNVFEVRLDEKIRMYVCPNIKQIIRIDIHHEHVKIKNYIEQSVY